MSTCIDQLRNWFGTAPNQKSKIENRKCPAPAPGQILLLTGPSGSGKSTLLRHYRRRLPRFIDLSRIPLPRRPLVETLPGLSLADTLAALSRVGLAEARLYTLRPHQLSTGQRWRLRLALALHQARHPEQLVCLICDEFAAPLDGVTAAIIAHLLRTRIHRNPHLSAIVATARDDVAAALRPDLILECDFGQVTLHKGEHHA